MSVNSGSTFMIECPCCGERLEIERSSGKIIKRWPKPEISDEEDFLQSGLKKLEDEKARLSSYFDDAGDILKEREKNLASAFEKEKKNVEESEDFSRPENPFDLD